MEILTPVWQINMSFANYDGTVYFSLFNWILLGCLSSCLGTAIFSLILMAMYIYTCQHLGKLITVPIAIKINLQGAIRLSLFVLSWANWYFQLLGSRCICSEHTFLLWSFILASNIYCLCFLLLISFNLLHNCGCALLLSATHFCQQHIFPPLLFSSFFAYTGMLFYLLCRNRFFNENNISLPWGSLALPVISLSAVLLHRTIVPIAVLSSSTEPESWPTEEGKS